MILSVICSFFGHRDISYEFESELHAEIKRHIIENHVDTFYVGGYGEFDFVSAGILRKMQKTYPNIKVYKILAYIPTKAKYSKKNEDFETIYPDGLEFIPKRITIIHRNRWIVEHSDYLITYISKNHGGAYEALKYAKQKNKNITNLCKTTVYNINLN